jgi:hypothetical protein
VESEKSEKGGVYFHPNEHRSFTGNPGEEKGLERCHPLYTDSENAITGAQQAHHLRGISKI